MNNEVLIFKDRLLRLVLVMEPIFDMECSLNIHAWVDREKIRKSMDGVSNLF
jgi:hypothetical protein